ncbi:Endonuclease/exonuclease/phosphatase [Cystobasidium minutum MCA 4210]|uniref:Endonuclease/exonuclease/phosphatase n=1 Tax=Cystobasidium minutum MCA 4210 TaxID=1397322 RepID=UPI0034CE6275|eukprot:jgi/Rhomi1/209082/estExt_Genemark1.C_2_t20382
MSALRQVPLYKFCINAKQWQAVTTPKNETALSESPDAASNMMRRLTCMTYNVFSGALSKSVPHATHRTRHAIDLLARSKCDVIALQEVSPAFEQALRREAWLRQDWHLTSLRDYFETASGPNSNRSDQDGCIMAVKRAILDTGTCAHMTALPGDQGKVLIMIRAANGIHFVTSHFESLASSERTRLHQYEKTSALLKDVPTAIILADFNHSSYGELKSLVGPVRPPASASGLFTDCAVVNHETTKSQTSKPSTLDPLRDYATFGELYPFFEGSRRREKRKPRRLDIVLARGDNLKLVKLWTDGSKPVQIDKRDRPHNVVKDSQAAKQKSYKVKLRCQQGKGGNLYASDHLAVLATFDIT